MSTGIFFAVLFAALIHASWNAIIKTGASKQASMMAMTVSQGAIGLVVVTFAPPMSSEALPWLLASGVVHMFYQLFLAYAYEQGDLSRVYPIARGAAPIIVFIVSISVLAVRFSWGEMLGVGLLTLGIICMASGAFHNQESRRLVPYALGSAVATAGYTLIDGWGARISGEALTYVGWVMVLAAIFYVPAILLLRGREVLELDVKGWGMGALSGLASFVAYAIVVWAMTKAPIALVAALRETSILFAMLIGVFVLSDETNKVKLASGGLILAGAVLTRI